MRRIIGFTLATLLTFMLVMAFLVSADSTIITSNKRGTYGDFDYEFWMDKGEASMAIKENGTFECAWDKNKTSNVLFRMGKKLGSTKTYEEYGDIIMEYGAEHKITSGDVSYLCVYGWTEDPMIEWYIVENYGNYKLSGEKGFQGIIEVDGGTYGVYTNTRVNMPSIQGNKTFTQYFSFRIDKRTSGTITISDHFKAWEELGFDMSGKMYEVALCVEGYQSSGTANIYSHMLTLGDTTIGAIAEPPSTKPIETAESIHTDEVVKLTEPEEIIDTTSSNDTDEAIESDDSEYAVTSTTNTKTGIESYIFIIFGVLVVVVGCIFLFTRKAQKK